MRITYPVISQYVLPSESSAWILSASGESSRCSSLVVDTIWISLMMSTIASQRNTCPVTANGRERDDEPLHRRYIRHSVTLSPNEEQLNKRLKARLKKAEQSCWGIKQRNLPPDQNTLLYACKLKWRLKAVEHSLYQAKCCSFLELLSGLLHSNRLYQIRFW